MVKHETYHHTHPPIPEAIVQLLKPIYARLGNRVLLSKCVDGYTQNANESFHSLVWKLCPKILHLGKEAVETACALAVCQWNDGMSSFQAISDGLGIPLTSHSATHLHKRDIVRVKKARYHTTDRAKALCRKARKIKKGLDDTQKRKEGDVVNFILWILKVEGLGRGKGRLEVEELRRGKGKLEVEELRRGKGRLEVEELRRGMGRLEVEELRRGKGKLEVEELRRGKGRLEVEELRRMMSFLENL